MASPALTRRHLVTAGSAAALAGLAGCARPVQSTDQFQSETTPIYRPIGEPGAGLPPPTLVYYRSVYGPMPQERFPLPAIPIEQVEPVYYRQRAVDPTGERPGSVVVDTDNHFLYLVQEKGEAIRYGVGLGREGFAWAGRAEITWKQPWPTWTPPADMIARQPELARYSADNGGMPPGLGNPLGARALYIFQNGRDTLYRIHGSPEWQSIGKSVSSGCVRMINQDVIDLYNRVPDNAPILVAGGIPTSQSLGVA